MIVAGWHVEGFGILRDLRVEGLGAGLTVVLGPNEAGKSTLLDFVRFALFGRERGAPVREPLRGGRHGGRLFLLDDAGHPWILERYAAPRRLALIGPDGREAPEADLARLLGGVDARLFRSVFAFGLWELSQFESLADDQVRDQIFSAGITGAGALATRTRQALEAETQRLLRPRSGARINELLEELRQAREQLQRAREAAARHPELVAVEEEARAEAERLEAQWRELERERQFYQALVELWPLWIDHRQAEAEAASLALPLSPEQEAELLVLAGDARVQRRRLEERGAAESRLAAGGSELAALLSELGPDWTRTRVREFALPVPAADELESWQRRLEEASREAADARRALEEAEARLEELGREHRSLREEHARLAGAPTRRQVGEQRDRLDAIERRLAELRALQTRLLAAGAAAGVLLVLGAAGLAQGLQLPGALLLGAGAVAALAAALVLGGPYGREAAALKDLAAEAGLPARPRPDDLEAARGRLRFWEEEAEARAKAEEDLRKAEDDFRRASERRDRLAVQAKEAERRRREAEEEWLQWKRRRGLPEGLSAAGVGRFLALLRAARDKEADVRGLEAELERLRAEIGAWRGRAAALLAAAGRDVPADEGRLVAEVEALAERCRRAAEARRRAEERGRVLLPRLGGGETGARLRERLEAGDHEAWEAALAELEERASRLRQERDRAIERRRDAQRAREELESSADVPAAAARVAALEAELAAAVDEWRVRRLALALLDRTLEAYVRDRQPEVLQVASRFFARVTGGRYVRVVQEADGQGLAVLDRDGGRRRPEQLSRGTAEQLYLALRLGLADSFARRAVALPLVMDDVLVNFDPEREERLLQALGEYLGDGRRQAILFTCHPETAELAAKACRPCRVVELPAVAPAPAEAAAAGEVAAAAVAGGAAPGSGPGAADADAPGVSGGRAGGSR